MRSSKDMMSGLNTHMVKALNDEYDRQCDAARIVLNKFVTDKAEIEVEALFMIQTYANIMFRFIWTDASVFGQRTFTSPLKFAVDGRDLDLVLRLRRIAESANKLGTFEQQVAEHAHPTFYKRYRTAIYSLEATTTEQPVLDTTFKPIVGSYPSLHKKATRSVNSSSTHQITKLAKLVYLPEESQKIKSRH